jgi:ectoine hydroxylase-related dioxygenase (phytanoyl-CoA dioxygenase family)
MKVIPGTHSDDDAEYADVDPSKNTFSQQALNVNERKTVYFELESNQCSVHDARLLHGADGNTNNRRRCGYTMRYFSQQMKFNMDFKRNRTHRMWHCRGRNPYNNPMEN